MPLEISQLRPEGLQAAVDFAKSAGFECEAKAVDIGVSLIAREGETPVAVVLGVQKSGTSFSLEVCLGKTQDPASLTRELIDKTLMKVKAAGVRRCQINYHGPDDVSSDWPNANWVGEPSSEPDSNAGNEIVSEPESCAASELDSEPDSESVSEPDSDTADNLDSDAA